MHDEYVFKAGARRWLPWLLASFPLSLSGVPISPGKENWLFLTVCSCATLYALIERRCKSVCAVACELAPLKRVTPDGNIHVPVCHCESEKGGWYAALVHSVQKCTGHFRTQTSHLLGSWFTSSRQRLALWLLVFSHTHYKCILIFMQNHSPQHIWVYKLYS